MTLRDLLANNVAQFDLLGALELSGLGLLIVLLLLWLLLILLILVLLLGMRSGNGGGGAELLLLLRGVATVVLLLLLVLLLLGIAVPVAGGRAPLRVHGRERAADRSRRSSSRGAGAADQAAKEASSAVSRREGGGDGVDHIIDELSAIDSVGVHRAGSAKKTNAARPLHDTRHQPRDLRSVRIGPNGGRNDVHDMLLGVAVPRGPAGVLLVEPVEKG